MPPFHLTIPMQVRYGDIDAQRHVNNAKFLTYLEQARFQYMLNLGLWDGYDFNEVGLIVADIHVAYRLQIELLQQIQVAVRVAHIGNKSLRFEFEIQNAETGALMATCETVMVAYNYHTRASQRVPDAWREKISAFEQTTFA